MKPLLTPIIKSQVSERVALAEFTRLITLLEIYERLGYSVPWVEINSDRKVPQWDATYFASPVSARHDLRYPECHHRLDIGRDFTAIGEDRAEN